MPQPDTPIVVFGHEPRMMFLARLMSEVYGEAEAIRAMTEYFGLSSEATTCILQQLHANDN